MSEIVKQYVEVEPFVVTDSLAVGPEERTLLAENLVLSRAEWVAEAVTQELLTRRAAAVSRAAELKEELQPLEADIEVIDSTLGISTPEHMQLNAIVDRFHRHRMLETEGFLEDIADEAPFRLTLIEHKLISKSNKTTWGEVHKTFIAQHFGEANKLAFIRASNSLARSEEKLHDTQGLVSDLQVVRLEAQGGWSHEKLTSLKVEQPVEFLKYCIEYVNNFGKASAAAVIAMSALQKLPEFSRHKTQ